MNGYIFALIFSLLPGFFAIRMVQTVLFVRKMQRVGIPVQGVIVSQRRAQRARGYETYQIPRVRFQTLEGQLIEGESWRQDGEVEFFDGDEAYLRYDPTQPTHFLFVQELRLPPYWEVALLVLFLGVAVGVAVNTALATT